VTVTTSTQSGPKGLSLGEILNSLISAPVVLSQNPAPAAPPTNQNPSEVLFPSGTQNQVQTTATLNNLNLSTNATAVIEVQQAQIDVTAISQTQLSQIAVNSIEVNQASNPISVDQGTAQPNLTDPTLKAADQPLTPAQTLVSGTVIDQTIFTASVNVPNVVTPQVNPVETPVTPAVNPAGTGNQKESSISVTVQDVSNPNPQVSQVRTGENAGVILVSPPNQPPVPLVTPPAVSTVQNVPASIVTGEVAKEASPVPPALKNTDVNNSTNAQNLATVSEVKPVTPEAVNPIALGSAPSTDLKANFDQSKITNNNSTPELLPTLIPNPANLTGVGTDPSTVTNAANNNVSKPDTVQILGQVTNQITAHASEARAVSHMSFQLIPESLGRVTVQIALVDQSLSARFIVSSPVVKEALQHHMIELKTALNQSGLQIDQLQVQVQGGGSNLLAQYYQYQQEGFAAGLPGYGPLAEEANSLENIGVSEVFSTRQSLVDMLA
jgi:hypothetical protein